MEGTGSASSDGGGQHELVFSAMDVQQICLMLGNMNAQLAASLSRRNKELDQVHAETRRLTAREEALQASIVALADQMANLRNELKASGASAGGGEAEKMKTVKTIAEGLMVVHDEVKDVRKSLTALQETVQLSETKRSEMQQALEEKVADMEKHKDEERAGMQKHFDEKNQELSDVMLPELSNLSEKIDKALQQKSADLEKMRALIDEVTIAKTGINDASWSLSALVAAHEGDDDSGNGKEAWQEAANEDLQRPGKKQKRRRYCDRHCDHADAWAKSTAFRKPVEPPPPPPKPPTEGRS